MPMCQPGKEIPDQGIVPTHLVVEGPWGELWRAEHTRYGKVLFVAYTTAVGMELFRDSLDALKRWKQSAPAADGLLGIKEISAESAIPFIVVEDPGGETLREACSDREQPVDPLELARWFRACAETLGRALNLNLTILNLTPDSIVIDPTKKNNPMRLVPVAPGATAKAPLLCEGKYVAPELPGSALPKLINADSYSLAWLLVDALLGGDPIPRHVEDLKAALPAPKLIQALNGGLFSKGGSYGEAPLVDGALKRWLRSEAEEDLKVLRKQQEKALKELLKEKKKAAKSTKGEPDAEAAEAPPAAPSAPSVSKIARKPVEYRKGGSKSKEAGTRKIVVVVASILAAGAAAGGVIFAMKLMKPVKPESAFATATVYLDEACDGDVAGASKWAADAGVAATSAFVDQVKKSGNAKGHAALTTERGAQGQQIARTAIKGPNDEILLNVAVHLVEKQPKEWRVVKVDAKKP